MKTNKIIHMQLYLWNDKRWNFPAKKEILGRFGNNYKSHSKHNKIDKLDLSELKIAVQGHYEEKGKKTT